MHQSKVLIVDDNVAGRYALARALRDEGYDVVEASNGTECLQRAGDPEIGLILLDINLPG